MRAYREIPYRVADQRARELLKSIWRQEAAERGPAEGACAQANFTATAQRLSAAPLLRGVAA